MSLNVKSTISMTGSLDVQPKTRGQNSWGMIEWDESFLIAEIGSTPDLSYAYECARTARQAGFQALKVQLYDWRELCTAAAPTYSQGLPERQADVFRGQCLDRWDLARLRNLCQQLGLLFFASAWDEDSVDICLNLGMPLLKIGSGDITNEPLLRYIAGCGVPVILSTGASYLWEVQQAVGWLARAPQIALAACTLAYPCPVADACLNRVIALQSEFPEFDVGYSDHCAEPWIVGQARQAGARFVEAHWTVTPGGVGDRVSPCIRATRIACLGRRRATGTFGVRPSSNRAMLSCLPG